MRKLSFFLAFALGLTFACGALAQTNDGIVSIDNTTNEVSVDQLRAGKTHVVSIRYDLTNTPSEDYWVGTNGFEIYSPEGANWVYLQGAAGSLVETARTRHVTPLPTQLSRFRKHYETVDRTADPGTWIVTTTGGFDPAILGTQGINSAAAFYLGTLSVPVAGESVIGGYIPGENDIALTLEFQTLLADSNKTICLDTIAHPQICAWEWTCAGLIWPQWDNGDGLGTDGPRCWEIVRCCEGRVGDVNGMGSDEPTIGDVNTMIDALFITGTCDGIIKCFKEADINQTGGLHPACSDVTIGDISTLIDYMFITGPELGLPECL